jgi:hypothetical protein
LCGFVVGSDRADMCSNAQADKAHSLKHRQDPVSSS